jgi:hypothetical protein
MKEFIKENLRIQLENLLYEVKENFEELPRLIRSKITRINSKEELIELSKLAKKLANKYYGTFGGIYDGTGTYTFKITKSGNGFIIKSDMGKDDREYMLGQEGKSLRLNAKAYTDQEENLNFKDSMDDENKGKSVFSPIVDAKIKILADDQMIKNIMDFDFENSYTSDAELQKNKELAANKTDSDVEYKRSKLDLDKKNNPDFKRKDTLSIDGPDFTKEEKYKRLLSQYKTKLELSKKINNPALMVDLKNLESQLDNYGK